MMKNLLAITLIIFATTGLARENTVNMTCAEARQKVQDAGAIVLSYGPQHIYDRFVKNRSYCWYGDIAQRAWVPTKDTDRCLIGFRCVQNPR